MKRIDSQSCWGEYDDGMKTPPYISWRLQKNVTWPAGFIVRQQEKVRMDETLTKDWLKHVWLKFVNQHRRMLVLHFAVTTWYV